MTAVKFAKIIGISCIVFVLCSMLIPGTYTILVGLLVLLPLALYGRHLMIKEEKETKQHLDLYHATCAFMGICYEGYAELAEKEKCEIMFKRNEVMVFGIDNTGKVIRKFSISKDRVKSVEILTLDEIKEKSQTNMYELMGKLGEYFYENIGDPKIIKKSKKDKRVNYLIINFLGERKSNHTISIFSNDEFKDFNRRASLGTSIEKFSKENY